MKTYLYTLLAQASNSDWEDSLTWYNRAHDHARNISTITGTTIESAAYTIAALSPMAAWPETVRAAYLIAEHYAAGGTYQNFCVKSLCIVNSSRVKAFEILAKGPSAIGNGMKTRSFADNILYPNTSMAVTIDVWAYRAVLGLVGTRQPAPHGITEKRYQYAAAEYSEIAACIGLLPLQVQAIVWVAAHRIENKPL